MMKWNRRNKALLLENWEMYVSAGLTLHEAVQTSCTAFSKKEGECIKKIISSIERGQNLSSALSNNINLSAALLGLIGHGESSGSLPRALGLARNIIEHEDVLIKSCMSALAYPIVIGVFACLLTVGLMRGVMPQITPLLKSLHVELPLITRISMYLSENIIAFGLYIVVALTILFPACIYIYRNYFKIRLVCHKLLLIMPIVGHLISQYNLSIFTRSLGGLITSDASLIDSYGKVVDKLFLLPMKIHLENQLPDLMRGVSLSTTLANMQNVPTFIIPLIKAGQVSGTLGSSLIRASDILDKDIENILKRLTALIEPIMMIGIGVVVGGIALSIMLPIYDVSKTLQH